MSYPNLNKYPYFGLDTEATGLQYKIDKVFGFSIAVSGKSWYWDLRRTPKAKQWLKDQLDEYLGTIIFANASFDIRMLSDIGVCVPMSQSEDVIIRASCIDEHLPVYSLDYLSNKYLGKRKLDVGPKGNLANLPYEDVKPYAKTDAELTLELWEWQEAEIERQDIRNIIEFEKRCMPSFIRAEMRGIRVDLPYTEKAIELLTPEIDKLQLTLGADFNVNSSPQVKKLFGPREITDGVWVTDAGEPLGTTAKGAPSCKAEYLRELSDPRARTIIDLRSLLKTRDTFLGQHILEHQIDGRVYPTINQSQTGDLGTGTGRLSMSDPAMQQIPSRNKTTAAIVKPCFLPDEGQIWVSGDMASFEVRVFAHLVNNSNIIQAYKDDPELDFHQYVADISGLVRNAEYSGQPNAKQMNLSMIFNSGNGAIAHKMGMPYKWTSFETRQGEKVTYRKAGPEAMKVIQRYHSRIHGVKDLAERAASLAKSTGYVFTQMGRRLRFPKGYKSYKASGLLIQATSADINKENWMMIEEELDGVGHMIVNTHDDYNLSLPEDWKPHFKRVQERIQHPRLRVPLILELSGAGENWWKAIS